MATEKHNIFRDVLSEKRCAKCQMVKPSMEFYHDVHRKDGLSGYCKVCVIAKSREHALAHPTETKARFKAWAVHKRAAIQNGDISAPLAPEDKKCAQCLEVKATSEFYSNVLQRDGLGSYCKECQRANTQQNYAAHPEERRLWRERFYQQYGEEIKAERRHGYWECPEKFRDQKHQIYIRNSEKYKALARQWRAENPGGTTPYVKAWRAKNPAADRALRENRRVKESGARITKTQAEALFAAYHGLCAYCRKPVGKKWHMDHIVPLSRGGAHHIDNLAVACASCNSKKHNKTACEFFEYLIKINSI